jgi:uncharacterized membrane protein YraQ (UPF0718 family)
MNILSVVISVIIAILYSYSVSALSPVRITEIMYDPSGDGSKEFIEFYNGSDTTVQLGGWSTYGVDFVFPPGSSLSPSTYTIIARNAAALQSSHPGARISGQYMGKLRGSGELIRLQDSAGGVVSQVSYSFGGAWPSEPRNGGPSLSLIWPNANETIPGCWGSSTALGGSPGFSNSAVGGGGCSTLGYPVTPPPPPPAPVAQTAPTLSPSAAPTASPNSPSSKSKTPSGSTSSSTENKSPEQVQAQIVEQKKQAQAQQKKVAEQKIRTQKQNSWRLITIIMGIIIMGVGAAYVVRKHRLKQDVKTVLKKRNA